MSFVERVNQGESLASWFNWLTEPPAVCWSVIMGDLSANWKGVFWTLPKAFRTGPPSCAVYSMRSLKLIFKAKVKLKSGNQKIQYGRQAAILKVTSLKINRLLPMATINMHMKFEIEIPQETWLMLRKPCRLQTDGRTDGRTDGQTDGRTDGQGESSIPPLTSKESSNSTQSIMSDIGRRLSASATNMSLPGCHCNRMSYRRRYIWMRCKHGLNLSSDFVEILIKGLWSVMIVTCFPKIKSWNLRHAKSIVHISFSIGT